MPNQAAKDDEAGMAGTALPLLPANHKITRQVQVKDKEEEVGTSTRSQCDFEQNIRVLWDDFEMIYDPQNPRNASGNLQIAFCASKVW